MRALEVWWLRYLRTTVTQFSNDLSLDEFYTGYYVCHRFQLKKDPKRELATYYTPDEAETIAHELLEQARIARERTAAHVSVTDKRK